MEEHIVKILDIEQVTPDVKTFQVEKPAGYSFIPGQATEVSINKPALRNEKRPFTFTCLNTTPYLEFTIKIYQQHKGVTNELGKLRKGAELIIREVWGEITYKGKGIFIAGGAGITPFIAILRDLQTRNEIAGNMLLFANKKRVDIIRNNELRNMLGEAFVNVLSEEKAEGYFHGMIDEGLLKTHIPDLNMNFYVCGPPPMMDAIQKQLENLDIPENSIIMEPI